eukprot:scaffold7011_cov67-Phaeocystis_antarctica.AAC.4
MASTSVITSSRPHCSVWYINSILCGPSEWKDAEPAMPWAQGCVTWARFYTRAGAGWPRTPGPFGLRRQVGVHVKAGYTLAQQHV